VLNQSRSSLQFLKFLLVLNFYLMSSGNCIECFIFVPGLTFCFQYVDSSDLCLIDILIATWFILTEINSRFIESESSLVVIVKFDSSPIGSSPNEF
jgi:hypothetical protein